MHEKPKLRPASPTAPPAWPAARRPRLALALAMLLLLLGASCQRKLNQLNGHYYSARDMARMKAERRNHTSSRGTTLKTKTKTASPAGAASAGSAGSAVAHSAKAKHVIRSSSAKGVLADVIENARSYQGVPYLYGGTTRSGIDCSALLMLSFADAGVTIPRSSNEQAAWGDPIKPTELRPGDFLFFGPTPGSGTITHVGMVTVVDADGVEFIHASTSLGVVENSLESDYYLSRFVRAVRPRLQ